MLSAIRKKEIDEFLKILNIKSDNMQLFDTALTHPSFNNEENRLDAENYERLEFLGDSVVRLIVSNYLYDKYPDYHEGNLTKIRSYLVSDEFFSHIALSFSFDKYINIGIHEEKDGGRHKESILACSFEAVLGAIFKSKGYEIVKDFIYSIYDNINIENDNILNLYNSKEVLQQYTQGFHKNLPEYKLISEEGAAHNRTYNVSVYYEGQKLGEGSAKTKKDAEKAAAFEALKKLKLIGANDEK